MGIGAKGEPRIVVAQHGGDRFDVRDVLEGHGNEGVTKIVEPNAGKSRVLQDTLVEGGDRVRMVHLPGGTGGEQIGILGVFVVLLDEKFYRLMRDRYLTDGGLGLGPGELQAAVQVADILLANWYRLAVAVWILGWA